MTAMFSLKEAAAIAGVSETLFDFSMTGRRRG